MARMLTATAGMLAAKGWAKSRIDPSPRKPMLCDRLRAMAVVGLKSAGMTPSPPAMEPSARMTTLRSPTRLPAVATVEAATSTRATGIHM